MALEAFRTFPTRGDQRSKDSGGAMRSFAGATTSDLSFRNRSPVICPAVDSGFDQPGWWPGGGRRDSIRPLVRPQAQLELYLT